MIEERKGYGKEIDPLPFEKWIFHSGQPVRDVATT
jgi:hypothetical protein